MRFWTWLIARLTVAVVLVGWVVSALFLLDSGKKELQSSLDALKKVDSFHYTMAADTSSQHTEEEADLVCSEDSFHRKTHVERTSANNPLVFDIETLRSNDQEFRLMPTGLWRRDRSGLETPKTTCQRVAHGQKGWIVPDIGKFIEYGMIEKGDKKTIGGKRCREWKIADLSTPGPLVRKATRHVTLCLDIDDHLPREMLVAETNSRWTYDFDKPIHIDLPSPLEPEPAHDSYQGPQSSSTGLTLSDPNEN
jgi:hypothetical protein